VSCTLRREHFEIRETLAQPASVKLIDGEHADATLRATWSTNKPAAASTRGICQRAVHDLDQLIYRRWLVMSHFSKDNLSGGP